MADGKAAKGFGVFWNDENVLKSLVAVAQLCEYTKNHLIIPFKWMNVMVCVLYLNKAVTQKKDFRVMDIYKQMEQQKYFQGFLTLLCESAFHKQDDQSIEVS